jgi:hypothetical protein
MLLRKRATPKQISSPSVEGDETRGYNINHHSLSHSVKEKSKLLAIITRFSYYPEAVQHRSVLRKFTSTFLYNYFSTLLCGTKEVQRRHKNINNIIKCKMLE